MPISPYVKALRQRIGRELLMLTSVSVALFDAQGRLLMAETPDRLWMTIGGAIDPDETPADAAVREMWEETGLLVEPVRLLGVHGGPEFRVTYANGDAVLYTAIQFEARLLGGTARPDGVETLALRYVTAAEAAALPTAPRTRRLLATAFARGTAPTFAAATWRPL